MATEPRRPMTGTLTIEWVDTADPHDPAADPNFGYQLRRDPQLDPRRTALLLRLVAGDILETADEIERGAATYLKVVWHHDMADEPVELFSELDPARMELRKVEVYRDGRHDFAEASRRSGTTQLSDGPLPTFEEIAGMGEFTPTVISAEKFELVWRHATAA